MKKTLLVLLATACAAAATAAPARATVVPEPVQKFDRVKVAVPFTRHTLPNGLTLLVHEDHSVPVVSVHLWYNVGSRNEGSGKTGFAHLFEHLFSGGSEHYPRGFREAMNDLGATNLNGFTDSDRTLFFEDVPAAALERTIYLEADRMGFLEKQISKESVDRERGIVRNESRQKENQPYGRVSAQVAETIYPASHPYRWTAAQSMQDLDSASVDVLREWYRTYYAPNNCVISLAGDVTPEQALELVNRYFGSIPPGPPLHRIKEWVPRLDRNVRAEAQDRVPQARVYRIYHAPGWRSGDVALLQIAASVLSGSSSARLDRRLVTEKQLVAGVRARVEVRELSSQFSIVATVKPGVEPTLVEREIDGIVSGFLKSGPTLEELQRARVRELAAFVRDNERLGSRAGLLAESMTYTGRPDAYLDRLEAQANAPSAAVTTVANRWLGENHFTLIVHPYPSLSATKETIDRSIVPPPGADSKDVGFPTPQATTLPNGLKVILLERHGVPMVFCALVVDAGYAADPADKRGLASLALALLRKGTLSRDAFQVADELDAVGARLSTGNTLDLSLVFLEALSAKLGPSLDIYADVILHPLFSGELLETTRRQRLTDIAEDAADPGRTGMNFLRRLLYGEAHPYAVPLSGFGSAQTMSAITRDDVVAWHRDWFHSGNSTLVVSGDVTMAELLPQLERTLGRWQSATAPRKKMIPAPQPAGRKVYLIDQPGAQQSVIVGAHASEPGGQTEDIAIAAVIKGFGGLSTSRLNRNLRIEKQWSYNAWASLLPARGPRTFFVFAPVQTDKTKESLIELTRELRAIAGEKPIAGEEFANLMRAEVLSLPGRFATLTSIESATVDLLSYGFPLDYYSRYAQRVRTLTEADLASAARKYVHPDEMLWIIRGDLKKIEAGIRELGLGDHVRVDAEGRPPE